MKTIRVFLVDDERAVRQGLRMRLDMERDLAVVGEAADGQSALTAISAALPDVVLMDVELPVLDGIEATAALRKSAPACAVVMLSMHDDAETRARAIAQGAAGFVSKSHMDGALLDAIRRAAASVNTHEAGN